MSVDTTTITEPLGRGIALQSASVRPLKLSIIFGADRGAVLRTSAPLVRIGSGPDADLVLTDSSVSRAHVELRRTPEGIRIRDLGSRNGTVLEGRRVVEAFLAPGERISIGRTRIEIDEEPDETRELTGSERFGELVGVSESMRALFAALNRAAQHEKPVLLVGETGTGKELAARTLHACSTRSAAPVHLVDCHVKHGPLLDADVLSGATLILDELSAFPRERQGELLPCLDRAVDVRVIATSQLNLEELVRRGDFRADVLQRFSERIHLPPLRARPEDLEVLAHHLLARECPGRGIEPEMLALLAAHSWPGNVRELRNVLVRGILLDELAPPAATSPVAAYHDAREHILSAFERRYFTEVLERCGHDLDRAAEASGLSVPSLYRLIKKAGISIRELRAEE